MITLLCYKFKFRIPKSNHEKESAENKLNNEEPIIKEKFAKSIRTDVAYNVSTNSMYPQIQRLFPKEQFKNRIMLLSFILT